MDLTIFFGLAFALGIAAGAAIVHFGKKKAEPELMDCPKDLSDWVNSDSDVLWYVYDVDLMPEQIRTKNQVCGLRGFKYGWECRELAEKAGSK